MRTGEGYLARDHHFAAGTVPDRQLMSPPDLPRNTPVLDIFDPVQVCLGEALGDELYLAFLDSGYSRLGQGRHAHKPLPRDNGFNDGAAAVTLPYAHVMLGRLHQLT